VGKTRVSNPALRPFAAAPLGLTLIVGQNGVSWLSPDRQWDHSDQGVSGINY
jgi:hypothetical protein